MRQQLGLGLDNVGKLCLQHLGNALVVLLPSAPEQRLVCGILHQGVLKEVGRLRGMAALVEQFGLHELRQAVLESWLVQWRHRPQQRIGKLPPQHGAELCHLFDRGQPVQPRHQGILQGGRNRQGR